MIGGHTVEYRVRAGGVVGNDPSHGGALRRSGVGAEHESMQRGRGIELRENDARFDDRGLCFWIDLNL